MRVFLWGFVVFIAGCPSSPAAKALESCTNAQAEANFDKAAVFCREALSLDPDGEIGEQAQAKLDAMKPHLDKKDKSEKKKQSSDMWANVCSDYAKQCPEFNARKQEKCAKFCNEKSFKEKLEMCGFIFCGVKTKMCDNQEDNDTTIRKCFSEQGWKQ